MIRKSISWNIKQVCGMINKKTLSFNSPIQRPSGQWGNDSKSLLIHSILQMFVPDVYLIQTKTENGNLFDVIDGLQRLTIINTYIKDEWTLTKLPSIKLESTGENFDITGMKFSELPEEVQEEIKGYTLTFKIIEIEEDEDEEEIVNEIFYRLNNGKQVSREHLALVSAKKNIHEFVHNTLKENPLFTLAHFPEGSIKKSDREMTILQSIVLVSGLEYNSFASKDIEKFFVENDITEDTLTKVENAFIAIAESFKESNKFITKINIPIMTKLFTDNETDSDNAEKVEEFLNWYSKNTKKGDNYKKYCGAGCVKRVNVEGRITALQNMFNEFSSKNFDSIAKEVRKSQSKIQSTFVTPEISDNTSDVEVPDYIKEIAAHTEI
jgi:hypothetical protein